MVHGSLLLHHWLLSLDSFWTIDAVFYALGVAIAGLNYNLLFVIPALLATCVVIVAIAFVRSCSRSRAWIPGAIAVALLLALPSPDFAYYLFQGPWHVGTTLWSLVAYWLITRRAFGWPWVVATIFLSLALLGDLVALAIGVAPCLILTGTDLGTAGPNVADEDSPRDQPGGVAIGGTRLRPPMASPRRSGTFSYGVPKPPAQLDAHRRNATSRRSGIGLGGFPRRREHRSPGRNQWQQRRTIKRMDWAVSGGISGVGLGAIRAMLPKRQTTRELDRWRAHRATSHPAERSVARSASSGSLAALRRRITRRAVLTDTTFLTPAVVFASILTGMGITGRFSRNAGRLDAPPGAVETRSSRYYVSSALAIIGYGAAVHSPSSPPFCSAPRQLSCQSSWAAFSSRTISRAVSATTRRRRSSSRRRKGQAQGPAAHPRRRWTCSWPTTVKWLTDWYKGVQASTFFVYDYSSIHGEDVTAATAVRHLRRRTARPSPIGPIGSLFGGTHLGRIAADRGRRAVHSTSNSRERQIQARRAIEQAHRRIA